MLAVRTALAILLFCSSAQGAVTTTVVDVPVGAVTQRFLYLRPEASVANIVQLPGGDAILGLQGDGTMTAPLAMCNPVVRNRQTLADHGFSVALVDVDSAGVTSAFDNVVQVIDYMRARDNVPTWLIGESYATLPAVSTAIKLPSDDPVGLILVSPQSVPVSQATKITRPTFVLYHVLDPAQSAASVFANLTSAPVKKVLGLSGGNGASCGEADGYHTFSGDDAEFAAAIAGFIDNYNNAFTLNYEGLWWAAPAGSESGWGINFAHQGDTIFASWFTYDLTGKGLWLVMTAPKTAPNTYSGALYTTTGPVFNAAPFNPGQVTATQVGNGTLTFNDANDGDFTYTVNGIAQNKAITRQVFGRLPNCATATGSLAVATNYQDLWWAAPAGSESGWGINLTHQGDMIFATWFTYDVDHSPMWLVVTAPKTAPGVYSGTLYRTTGPAFNALPFNPANVLPAAVGSATFTFIDGNAANFAYTVNGVSQNKPITREIFNPPGTICQ